MIFHENPRFLGLLGGEQSANTSNGSSRTKTLHGSIEFSPIDEAIGETEKELGYGR